MFNSVMEILFVSFVLVMAIGGSAINSFLYFSNESNENLDVLAKERNFSAREAELEEEKQAA